MAEGESVRTNLNPLPFQQLHTAQNFNVQYARAVLQLKVATSVHSYQNNQQPILGMLHGDRLDHVGQMQ